MQDRFSDWTFFGIVDRKGHHSVCTNRQSYDGFMFNRFYCPLPQNTGMNQQDRFCCGIANYQYCCNEQFVLRNEFLFQ